MANNTVVLNIRVNANAAKGIAGLQAIENGMQQTAAAARQLRCTPGLSLGKKQK